MVDLFWVASWPSLHCGSLYVVVGGVMCRIVYVAYVLRVCTCARLEDGASWVLRPHLGSFFLIVLSLSLRNWDTFCCAGCEDSPVRGSGSVSCLCLL